MRTLAVVGTIALLLAGTAMGQSTIAYTLEIGGDNHVADWENATSIINTAFTNGSTTPAVQTTSPVTWDVVAACSGIDGTGNPAQGIANVVFNLELKDSLNNVVAAGWTSTMNDGDMQGARRSLAGTPDPLEKAAWCLGWDVDMNEDGVLDGLAPPANTGRIFDPVTAGGPYMDRVQFPSTSAFGGGRMAGGEGGYVAVGAMTTAAPAGMLMGMGVGYSQFVQNQNCAGVGLQVGIIAPFWNPFGLMGLGAEPLAEGQIDMTGMPGGTYTLVLTVPKDGQNNPMGQNVIKGNYDVTAGTGGFAAKADAVTEASVSFVWAGGPVCQPVTVAGWQSVKTHGLAGDFSLAMAATGASVEPRNGGLTQVKVALSAALADVTCFHAGAVTVSGGATASASLNAAKDTITINVSGAAANGCYTVSVAGAVDLLTGDADCAIAVLNSDVDGNKAVNLGDMLLTKSKGPAAVTAAIAQFDVDLNGAVNLGDMLLVKSKSGASVVCP